LIQCRLVFMKGAPSGTAGVRDVSTHEKQRTDTKEESGVSRGPGSDSIPGTRNNRCRCGNALPLFCLARTDRSAGLCTCTLLWSKSLEGVTAAIGSWTIRDRDRTNTEVCHRLPLQPRMVTGGTSTLHPRSRPLVVHLTSLVIACAQP
jgi:hypothetical protein